MYTIQHLLDKIYPYAYDIKNYCISTVESNGEERYYYEYDENDDNEKYFKEQSVIVRKAFDSRNYKSIKKAIFNTGLIPDWVYPQYCDILKNCSKQTHFSRYIKEAQKGEWDIINANSQEQGHFYSMVIDIMIKTKQMCDKYYFKNRDRRIFNFNKQSLKLRNEKYNQLKPILEKYICIDLVNIICKYLSFIIRTKDGNFIMSFN